MSIFVVDIEADGTYPGGYSMISFGVVKASDLSKTFYGECKPISTTYISDALAVSGFTREQTMNFPLPRKTMVEFVEWLKGNSEGRPQFYSDNNGFDWQFMNYYLCKFYGNNPFGHSSRNINDLYKGMVKDTRKNFKHLRKTRHTHHPVQDALGNAEALIEMKRMGVRIEL